MLSACQRRLDLWISLLLDPSPFFKLLNAYHFVLFAKNPMNYNIKILVFCCCWKFKISKKKTKFNFFVLILCHSFWVPLILKQIKMVKNKQEQGPCQMPEYSAEARRKSAERRAISPVLLKGLFHCHYNGLSQKLNYPFSRGYKLYEGQFLSIKHRALGQWPSWTLG